MTLRLEYRDLAPGAVSALQGLNQYSDECSISQILRRLIEIKVSQINGCSYCIDVHTKQAASLGETPKRVEALVNWQASSHFSDAESSAFAWAEAVTNISVDGAPRALFQELQKHYSEKQIVDLTFIVLSMNAWNRLAISFEREAPASAKP